MADTDKAEQRLLLLEMEKRMTAMRLWTDASWSHKAAQTLRATGQLNFLLIEYSLLAQSVECGCKGVLRSAGASIRDLKRYGHRLTDLVIDARIAGLPTKIDSGDMRRIYSLERYYAAGLLRYAVPGTYPGLRSDPRWLFDCAARLLKDALPNCRP